MVQLCLSNLHRLHHRISDRDRVRDQSVPNDRLLHRVHDAVPDRIQEYVAAIRAHLHPLTILQLPPTTSPRLRFTQPPSTKRNTRPLLSHVRPHLSRSPLYHHNDASLTEFIAGVIGRSAAEHLSSQGHVFRHLQCRKQLHDFTMT